MQRKGLYVLIFSGALLFLAVGVGFSQETTVTPEPQVQTQVPVEEAKIPAAGEPETQWLWGEVVSVDRENKVVVVKYLDYETDTEKEINLNVDDATMYDNIDSLGGLKVKDTVSIDYIVNADGKYIAKVISLEKIDEVPEAAGAAPVTE